MQFLEVLHRMFHFNFVKGKECNEQFYFVMRKIDDITALTESGHHSRPNNA